jgi:hypothetical protein
MKLVVREVSPWPVQTVGGTPLDLSRELSIIITPMEDRMERWAGWRERVLRAGVPAFARVEVTCDQPSTSALDWPVHVIDSTIVGADGKVIEARVSVLYAMLEWCAAVIFRGRPARVAAERERAMRVLRSGRPDWSRPEIVALAQLQRASGAP